MNPFASAVPQPLRIALIDAVGAPGTFHEPFCRDTGPHVVELLARALAQAGHAVDIYRARDAGEPAWEDLQSGVRIHRVAPGLDCDARDQDGLSLAVQGFMGGMRHLARGAWPCDVVHAFGLHAGLVGLRLTRAMRVPFILSLTPRHQADAVAAVEDLLLRRADGVIAVSECNRDALIGRHAAAPARVHFVPRGVDTQCFRPGRKAQLRRALGWPEDAFVVLWGGTADADAARLREALPVFRAASKLSAHMVVMGADSPWPAETAGIPGVSVVDLGDATGQARQAHLSTCYAAADLLVLPPWHRESEEIDAKEAMACGTPVLALTSSAGDEAARLVEDGVTGYVLHRPLSATVLQRMRLLCEQPRRHAAMSMAAVLRARTFHTWRKAAPRFANVYAHAHLPDHARNEGRMLTLVRTNRAVSAAGMPSTMPAGA